MMIPHRSLFAACASGLLWACAPGTVSEQPDDVAGRWTTDAPDYVDRAFEITEEFLYLHQGGDLFVRYRIESVGVDRDDLPMYTIQYRGEGGDIYDFRFYYSPEQGGTLFFPNQPEMKWHRDPDAEVPWASTSG